MDVLEVFLEDALCERLLLCVEVDRPRLLLLEGCRVGLRWRAFLSPLEVLRLRPLLCGLCLVSLLTRAMRIGQWKLASGRAPSCHHEQSQLDVSRGRRRAFAPANRRWVTTSLSCLRTSHYTSAIVFSVVYSPLYTFVTLWKAFAPRKLPAIDCPPTPGGLLYQKSHSV